MQVFFLDQSGIKGITRRWDAHCGILEGQGSMIMKVLKVMSSTLGSGLHMQGGHQYLFVVTAWLYAAKIWVKYPDKVPGIMRINILELTTISLKDQD